MFRPAAAIAIKPARVHRLLNRDLGDEPRPAPIRYTPRAYRPRLTPNDPEITDALRRPRYAVTMLLVGAIAAVAVPWCHLNHLRRYQGPLLFALTDRHGVHIFDLAMLAAEIPLLAIPSGVLIAGFSRH